MRPLIFPALLFATMLSVSADAENATVSPNGSRPTANGLAANFTGNVLVEPLFGEKPGITATGGQVVFAPGARSAWHKHPAGQVLIITDGTGWIQEEGGTKREVKPGDVIWTPPGVKHWHGATATNGMRHIAISGMINGKNVDWMEKVSDEQYRAP